ncbi:hypothetical protein KAT36_03945 [Candidatus Pacearchaeota archaeon]|nr:hypothetical protein [Candidatus Pacearchaeota archaeon]
MNKKITAIIIAMILIAGIIGGFLLFKIFQKSDKNELIVKFQQFQQSYNQKQALGYDLIQVDLIVQQGKMAFNRGDYKEANKKLNQAIESLEKLKKPEEIVYSNRVCEEDNFGLHIIWDRTVESNELNVNLIRGMNHFNNERKLRDWIKLYQNAGLDIVLSLIPNNDVWRNSVIKSIDLGGIPGGADISGFPSNVEAYKKDLVRLVEGVDGDGVEDYSELRYPIKYIQVGNEVFWQWYGNPPSSITNKQQLYSWRLNHLNEVWQSYGEFLKITYETIKAENPDMMVILGDIYGPDLEVTDDEKIVLTNYRNYFDIADVHFYGNYKELEETIDDKDVLFGMQKPIWSLEIGGPMKDYTLKEHAEEVVKMQLVLFEKGIDKSFWSSLIPTIGWPQSFLNTALLDKSFNKKPAYYTYKILKNKINCFASVNKISSDEYFYKVKFDDKDPVFVLWSENGEKIIDFSQYIFTPNVKITHIVTELDADNNPIYPDEEIISSDSIQIDETPIFIEEV